MNEVLTPPVQPQVAVFHPVAAAAGEPPAPSEGAYELKFLLRPAQVEPVLDWSRAWLSPDPYTGPDGTYSIHSVYLDTPELDHYHRQPGYRKSKYRLRRYGEHAQVFLEQKLKRRGLVQKIRTAVSPEELEWLGGEPPADWCGAWFREVIDRKALQPRCYITYQRFARVGAADGEPVRLTVDRMVRCAPANALDFRPVQEPREVPAVILELKFRNPAMPRLYKELVRQFALQPASASKYRKAVEVCGFAGVGTVS